MKKFFSYLGTALVLALVVAVFTSTGKEQCQQYVADKMKEGTYSSLTVNEVPFKLLGAKIFATYTVSYYVPLNISIQGQADAVKTSKGSAALAALKATAGMVTETYLGLFNTFWKL